MKTKLIKIITCISILGLGLSFGQYLYSGKTDSQTETVTINAKDVFAGIDHTSPNIFTYKDSSDEADSSDNADINEKIDELTHSDNISISDLIKNKEESGTDGVYIINNSTPLFSEEEIKYAAENTYENYSELDSLGRCGVATISAGMDTLPTEERGSIGMIKPTGWIQNKYPDIIKTNPSYIYNRCHLIAFCISGENANELNLITGTRYMNENMIPYEVSVVKYIEDSNDRVLYRTTPVFENNNLLASGVLIEAKSCNSNEVSFCVYCENIQPGIYIDYSNGNNYVSEDDITDSSAMDSSSEEITFILNKNSKKFHTPACEYAKDISDKNKEEFTGTKKELTDNGYDPCKICNP